MTALEIAAIEHLLAVCSRLHNAYFNMRLREQLAGKLRIDSSRWDARLGELLDALSDAQSDVEDMLVSQ